MSLGAKASDYETKWQEILSQKEDEKNIENKVLLLKKIFQLLKEVHLEQNGSNELDDVDVYLVGKRIPFCHVDKDVRRYVKVIYLCFLR